MAKLTTPSHRCEQPYAITATGTVPHCPFAAYRRDSKGRWLCRKHLHGSRRPS